MSKSVTYEEDWSQVVANDFGLWVAAYPGGNPKPSDRPSVKYWYVVAMWQYTSTPYDKDYFYGDVDTWNAYAGKVAESTPEVEVNPMPAIETTNQWGQIIDTGYSFDTKPWGVDGFETILGNLDGHMGEYVHLTAKTQDGAYYETTLEDGTKGWLDHRALSILPSEPPEGKLFRIYEVK